MEPIEIIIILLSLACIGVLLFIFVKETKENKPITFAKKEQTKNESESKMNYCKICGQPSGIYEICRDCQKDIENGRVKYCDKCNTYYLNGQKCLCTSKDDIDSDEEKSSYKNEKSNEEPQINHNENINVEVDNSQSGGFASSFEKGCGGGCGVIFGIIIGIALLIIIAIAIGAGAINELFR